MPPHRIFSVASIRAAILRAKRWAEHTGANPIIDTRQLNLGHPVGEYSSPVERPWDSVPLSEKLDILAQVDRQLPIDKRIVEWTSDLVGIQVQSLYLTSDGGDVVQSHEIVSPDLMAIANQGSETQRRSLGARGISRQGGFELVYNSGFLNMAPVIASEALQLLDAPIVQAAIWICCSTPTK